MKKKTQNEINSNEVDTLEMLNALDEIEKDEGIDKEYLLDAIKQGLVFAYKKDSDTNDENIEVEIGNDGRFHVYKVIEVVEEPEDLAKEISLENARKSNDALELGDKIKTEIFPKKFGRIAAQTARQVISQKLKEKTREMIYAEFKDKTGEMCAGIVQKVTPKAIILDLGKAEGIMPKKEQISSEKLKVNDKVKAVIKSVEKDEKGNAKIIVSRSSKQFIKKSFEIEIPEIYEGVIEIKSISRIAGERTKIAVYSQNPDIDPVGSCVGQRGIRIQNIIKELHGEKIDVIEWSEDSATFIAQALLPATVMAVDVNESENFAQVIVSDDQFSLAIGKGGHNVKLAADLTGYKIDIKSETQFRELLAKKQEEDSKDSEEKEEKTNTTEDIKNETNTENEEESKENKQEE